VEFTVLFIIQLVLSAYLFLGNFISLGKAAFKHGQPMIKKPTILKGSFILIRWITIIIVLAVNSSVNLLSAQILILTLLECVVFISCIYYTTHPFTPSKYHVGYTAFMTLIIMLLEGFGNLYWPLVAIIKLI